MWRSRGADMAAAANGGEQAQVRKPLLLPSLCLVLVDEGTYRSPTQIDCSSATGPISPLLSLSNRLYYDH
jgi:hypothetical protein